MAMEKHFMISDTHSRTITAIGFHPLRREIVVGFEDGVTKWWEQETGKLMLTNHEHLGWVTDFQYWTELKLLFSSGNDGLIVAWGSGGHAIERIQIGQPIYVMCMNLRRQQIICGFNGEVNLYSLDPTRQCGNAIDKRKPFVAKHHRDIVPCIICHESRVYTAGYDGKFCIYDTTLYPGTKGLDLTHCNSRAHEAGINCMILVKDNENNTWLITGSFDRTVKIWSQDGQLRHRLESIFLNTITSVCYIPRAKVVWIASGALNATLFDPKAGENVTEFLPTFQPENDDDTCQRLLKLRHNPESGQIVGSTNRRNIVIWKFNSSGCITVLKCQHAIESISYTKQVPMLLFSGGSSGEIYKWEQLQSSHFMYSMEPLSRKECMDRLEAIRKEMGLDKNDNSSRLQSRQQKRSHNVPMSHYAYNKPLIPPLYKKDDIALLRSIYVEHLDLLLVASEDGNIYLWGFDYEAVSALTQLAPDLANKELQPKFNVLMGGSDNSLARNNVDNESNLSEKTSNDANNNNSKPASIQDIGVGDKAQARTYLPQDDAVKQDSVTNRVAGFICKNVLIGHKHCVTAIAVVHNPDLYSSTYLISGGWDRRILIWCLETGKLHDCFRNTESLDADFNMNEDLTPKEEELACDGVILDIEYCQKRNEFAYASSDGMVYIREFNPNGSGMRMRNTLQGHELEITVVRWNPVYEKWVTGSEDGTIKIWSEDGMLCERTLSAQGTVNTLCIDKVNGSIVAAVETVLKVYDMETSNLVQTNIGHTENIRSIIHVSERSQYISGSWDKTIRIWNAYRRPIRRRRPNKIEES